MTKFKVGEIVIIDPQNKLDLSSWDPILGKIVRKVAFNLYEVDTLEFDNNTADYKASNDTVMLESHRLGKINDSGVVIRTPLNYPIINKKDLVSMENIIKLYEQGTMPRYDDITRLKIIINKINHFKSIFEDGNF